MVTNQKVNHHVSVAPLRNVKNFLELADTLINRNPNLPGLGVFYGFSGLGKTVAANFVRNTHQAHLVEVRDHWTRKAFVQGLLNALHVQNPRGTISDMMNQAARILGDDPSRLLIIDEADKLVDHNMIELVRDIHEQAQIPIILAGEELLPRKLESSERTHNRVLKWVMAELCDMEDARALAELFCGGTDVGDDLLQRIIDKGAGRARRIVTTLNSVATQVRNEGLKSIDLQTYAGPYSTGRVSLRHTRRAQ